jgi:hypothetical protein
MDLAQKIADALKDEEIPTTNPIIIGFQKIPNSAIVAGCVPDHLKRLYNLCAVLEREQYIERRRRHEQVFPGKTSGHETLEYMLAQEIQKDPNFGGIEIVRRLLDWSLRAHIPTIPLNRWEQPQYWLGSNWEVFVEEKKRQRTSTRIQRGEIRLN